MSHRIAIIAIILLVATGCGWEDDEKPAVQSATQIPASGASASSECWDEADNGDETMSKPMQWDSAPDMQINPESTYVATLDTNKGTFSIELLPGEAPVTVNNFVCLAKAGYFDGTPFHRIVDGFVIQGGDPTGTGSGGPGYRFNDEPVVRDYTKGAVAMANAGPNTNGSQFFVVLDDLTGKLPKNYTIFGQVNDGQEIVDVIGKTETSVGRSGEKSTPVEPITLNTVTIEEK